MSAIITFAQRERVADLMRHYLRKSGTVRDIWVEMGVCSGTTQGTAHHCALSPCHSYPDGRNTGVRSSYLIYVLAGCSLPLNNQY